MSSVPARSKLFQPAAAGRTAAPPARAEPRPHAPAYVFGDFHDEPDALRAGIDRHFDEPARHGPEHQVWNYWFVPDSYTYLRTSPEKVIEHALVDRFHKRLSAFVLNALGMDTVTWPFLSLYVEGCGQALHNDARNGEFGYVYSLTRWDTRRFRGGETLIFREQDYWASGRFRQSGAGDAFYELIPSRFNQLLLFDDRLLHGVPTVHGTLDPREGRVVLHGHVSARGISVRGPLAALGEALPLPDLADSLRRFSETVRGRYHGFATFAVQVLASGRVGGAHLLVDRVLSTHGPSKALAELAAAKALIERMVFPATDGESRLDVPVYFE